MNARVDPAVLDRLRTESTCVVASAIETFDVQLRNVGFADSSIRCLFGDLSPMAGYAATARLRSANPPMEGGNYHGRVEWWRYVQSVPAPRVVVIEDVDAPAGRGAFVGEVQARVLHSFGCVGVVTNGACRDLPQVRAMGLPLFAGNVAISHAFAHIFDFGSPVEVGRLRVASGDLVHGDVHGVQTVPLAIAARIPAVVDIIRERRRRVAALCRAPELDIDRLALLMQEFGIIHTSQ